MMWCSHQKRPGRVDATASRRVYRKLKNIQLLSRTRGGGGGGWAHDFFLPASHALVLVTWQNMVNSFIYLAAHMFSW